MKIAERIVLVSLLITFVGGGVWFYLKMQQSKKKLQAEIAAGAFEIKTPTSTKSQASASSTDWNLIYPELVPITIGTTTFSASVADSLPERIKGLSDTPGLPEHIVKLFAFGVAGEHSIWMKDMNYPIDIMWLDKTGLIVHIEENVSPETYPKSFASTVLAWYVIEAKAGTITKLSLKLGDRVTVPL
jgi:uncharacterized protein